MAVVELKIEDRIATITFNRPEALNALNSEVLGALLHVIHDLTTKREIGVAVLTGAGDKAFIAGADIKEMQAMGPVEASRFAERGQRLMSILEHLPQITIAAVNGFALGGGCELAMGCDLIYASEKAKFGQPEVNLGVIPGFGGTQRLWRLIGPMKAREMIYTARMMDAKEAQQLGLAAQVFPPEQLMSSVMEIAKTIASKGPEAIRRAKVAMREGLSSDLDRGCVLEREEFALCFAHPDQKEGMAAFLEKRKPNWGEPK